MTSQPRKYRSFNGIRDHIILYFGVLSLLVSGGLLYGLLYGIPWLGIEGVYKLKESEVVRALENAADAKKQSVAQWVNERRTDITIAANSKAFAAAAVKLARLKSAAGYARNPASMFVSDQLRAIKESQPGVYEGLVVVTAEGNIIAASDPDLQGRRTPFPEFVHNAFEVGATEQIGAVSDARSQLILISHQIAMRDAGGEETGQVAAVIIARLKPLQSLFASLPPLTSKHSAHMILVGAQGELIASVPVLSLDAIKNDPLAATLAKRAMTRTESSLMETLPDGKTLIAAYRFIPIGASDGWGIAIALDREEAFAALTGTMKHAVFFGLCITLAALLLVGWAADRIAQPIRELHGSVRALEDGDFAVRAKIDPRGEAEIGQLALAFNSMAQRIENWHLELEREVNERTEDLRREKDTAQRYLDVAGVMLIFLDRFGRIGMINKSGAAMLGGSEHELIGLNWFDNFLHPGSLHEVKAVFAALMRGESELMAFYENHILTCAKQERLFSWHNILLYDEAGAIIGVLSSGEDITIRRRSELERSELERQLLHTQKLESLGVMAGGIAHDFNNLLMAIGGNLELARYALHANDSPDKFIDNAFLASQRAGDLTRQMLAYSGKGGYSVKLIDLNQLVMENAGLLKASIAKGVTMVTRLGRELPSLQADPGQMQQVIMNLITNAAEAIAEGPGEGVGEITIATGIVTLDASDLWKSRLEEKPKPGDYISIEVTDSGCGMDREIQRRLFDPFFTTKFTGRGLGLSAVLGIIRGHNGAIFVDSVPGQGTSFTVLFPVSLAPSEVSGPEPREAERAKRSATAEQVLIVDDEEMVRTVCRQMVQGLGYQTMTACDGREAVELFRANADRISSVIMDLSMPHMDGLEAAAQIRSIRPGVAVILSSGYSQEEAARRLENYKGTCFIQKPYNLESLRHVLAECIMSA
jgi:PAS domain S-box-containing protein